MTKHIVDSELLERIRDLLYAIAHRQDDYGVEAHSIGSFFPSILAKPAADCGLERIAELEVFYDTKNY